MRRAHLLGTVALALLVAAVPTEARADDPYGLAPGSGSALSTWGASRAVNDATSLNRDSPVTQARELLTVARSLDEAATVDEKAAVELAAKLVSVRIAASSARDAADRAAAEDKELLGARAEDLETEVTVSEAEVVFKRTTAAENRRLARGLRRRAVRLVREVPPAEEPTTAGACNPPFRFTPDGRKIYRIECLK